MPDYEAHPDYPVLVHRARRRRYETHCDGCLNPLPGEFRWSELNQSWMCGAMLVGPYVAIITDESGSEWGVAHDTHDCIDQAAENLLSEDFND